MQTVKTVPALRKAIGAIRADGARLALVPTMGALHEGHLTLVREATRAADAVVVSIFVNPKQFGEGEDLDAYPQQMERDAALLEVEGVALLWAPSAETMYPAGFATTIAVGSLSEGLCGANRPGHFAGVATVVLKLFNQVRPDIAVFGEKDWQQLTVIRRMARDLDLARPTADAILDVMTVREADGLARSSRNAYLSPDERAAAAALPAAMRAAVAEIEAGGAVAPALERLREALRRAGFAAVDYATLADAATLEPLAILDDASARLLVAARIGRTRLIDNLPVGARTG